MSVILEVLFSTLLISLILSVFFAFYCIWTGKGILLWISLSVIFTLLLMEAGIIFGLGYTPDWYRISYYIVVYVMLSSILIYILSDKLGLQLMCMFLLIICSLYPAVTPVVKVAYDAHVTGEEQHVH